MKKLLWGLLAASLAISTPTFAAEQGESIVGMNGQPILCAVDTSTPSFTTLQFQFFRGVLTNG